jgi:hypothetical protein
MRGQDLSAQTDVKVTVMVHDVFPDVLERDRIRCFGISGLSASKADTESSCVSETP